MKLAERDRHLHSPAILIITHVIPYPPSAGNEIRILKMIGWLRSIGYYTILLLNHCPPADVRTGLLQFFDEVHLATDYKEDPPQRFTGDLLHGFLEFVNKSAFLKNICRLAGTLNLIDQKLEAKRTKRWLCPPELKAATASLMEIKNPDVVIAEYIFTAPCLDVVPDGVLKVIDTHDMFSRKKEQVNRFGVKDVLHCSRSEERSLLLKGDVIIAIQSKEAALFESLVLERKVLTVGIDYEVTLPPDGLEVDPATVLMVGSESPLNVHGLKEFYLHAWPEIRRRNSHAILKVVGKVGRHIAVDDESVVKIGWVESLDTEYDKATVVINPVPSGTGLKIKSVEALCRGKALVSTVNGVEGICVDEGEPPYITCHSWTDFADATVAILESRELRSSLEQRAILYARENLTTENIYRPLFEVLNGQVR